MTQLPKVLATLIFGLLLVQWTAGCQSQKVKSEKPGPVAQTERRYPPHWWKPYNRFSAPEWEVLPEEAGQGEVVLSKRNELGLLSNFAPTPFVLDGKTYGSIEGFWQMMLYPEGPHDPRAKFPGLTWKYTRDQVGQMTSFDAKEAGDLALENMKKMNIDWVSYEGRKFPYHTKKPGRHYQLIVRAMKAKLQQNPAVKDVLLATGDLKLKPDHLEDEAGTKAWKSHEIWMDLRSQLTRVKK